MVMVGHIDSLYYLTRGSAVEYHECTTWPAIAGAKGQ